MIDKAVDIIKKELDDYLKIVLDNPSEPVVEYTDLSDEGTPPTKIGVTVISIEEERGHKAQNPIATVNGVSQFRNPAISINVYLQFSSFYDNSNYSTGLKVISDTILFFQGKKVFNHENTPSLDEKIEVLFMDFHNLNTEQQNDLWGKFASNYRPSACYRMRMLIFQQDNITDSGPAINTINYELSGK